MAESLSPITKQVEEVNQSTKKRGEVIKEPNFENIHERALVESKLQDEDFQTNLRSHPNSSIFSDLMTKTIGSLMSSSNSLRIKASPSGPTIPGVPIYNLGGDKLRIWEMITK